ncbi:right-handed parallel beta-helix repeat-containing protein [bacterium]|nr:right-handed parallel beta-helix repeat-containing protein [bacterium]
MKIISLIFLVIYLLTCSAIVFCIERPEPAVKDFWVDAFNGLNTNDGSESKPWKTITYALSAISDTMGFPMTIHIRQGKYDLASGEKFPLRMREYISLVGYDPQNSIIDAANSNQSVIFCTSKNLSIENLTITGGTGILFDDYDYRGGGLLIEGSDVVLRNCIIRSNFSIFKGAGIYCVVSNARIIDSLITENHAGRYGGGIYCDKDSLQISNSYILRNGAGLAGGGIYCKNSMPKITACEIMDNNVTPIEAGLYYEVYGGGIAIADHSNATIESCKINFNRSNSFGGGIFCDSSSPMIIHCEINGNMAMTGSGGGIFSQNASPNLKNCLIIRNQAPSGEGGGIFCKDSPSLSISNNTMVDNFSPGEGAAITADDKSSIEIIDSIIWRCAERPIKGKIKASYCNIEGVQSDIQNGNFSSDPNFISGPWSEFYLSSIKAGQYINSPCIDKGSIEVSRINLNLSTTGTDGIFDKGIVDIGYHNSPHTQFNLHIMPDKYYFYDSERIKILLDLEKVPPSHFVDIYFIMINDSTGEIFSASYWKEGVYSSVSNMPLPIEIFFKNANIFEVNSWSEKPPIHPQGSYTFAMAAFLAGTNELISNITTTSFFLSFSPMLKGNF